MTYSVCETVLIALCCSTEPIASCRLEIVFVTTLLKVDYFVHVLLNCCVCHKVFYKIV